VPSIVADGRGNAPGCNEIPQSGIFPANLRIGRLGDRLASSAKGVKSRSLVVKEVVIEEVVGEGGGDHGDGDRRDAL
jgi:hypothetical protein